MDLKKRPFSCWAGILLSLLSCTFLVFYIWQHEFASLLHMPTTVLPASVFNHPVTGGPSAHRPPSVEYIDLASRHLSPPQSYNAQTSSQKWHGSPQPCLGPRGVNVNSNPDDMLKAWVIGSNGKR